MCIDCAGLGLTRRGFVAGAACVAALALAPPLFIAAPAYADDGVPGEAALKRLVEGNARYAANTSVNKDYSAGRAARALGQTPFATIVSCSDSRVAPEIVFDQGPGDLFVIRVAGNFVSESGLATVEYGGAVLGSRLIMVLGHSECGAIKATIDVVEKGTVLPGHLPSLADAIRPAVETAIAAKPANLLDAAIVENVKLNVAYLKTAKPIISDMVSAGTVDVVGGVYDIATGKVTMV